MNKFKIKLPMAAIIAAIVLAFATTAFTVSTKPLTTYTFGYMLSAYDQQDVQNVANWATGSPSCSGSNKACQITVDPAYTHMQGSVRVLNDASYPDHVTIVATQGSISGDYRVDASSTNLDGFANKN